MPNWHVGLHVPRWALTSYMQSVDKDSENHLLPEDPKCGRYPL
jgi:hypothetical protein